jgi:hypothetical protein
MRGSVVKDNLTRVIRVDLEDVPDLDITTYHRKPRIFRPDHVSITLADGTVSRVSLSGYLVLKSGGTSDAVRDSKRWYGSELGSLPKWLQAIVTDAPNGVTTWRTAETEAA